MRLFQEFRVITSLKEKTQNTSNLLRLSDSHLAQVEKLFRADLSHLYPIEKYPLPTRTLLKPGEFFTALVIGGTNIKSAKAHILNTGQINLQDIRDEEIIPSSVNNTQQLAQLIVSHVRKDTSTIALNFGYKVSEPIATRDGKLDATLVGSGTQKAVRAHDLEGKLIGTTLEQIINQRRRRGIRISVANDMAALTYLAKDYTTSPVVVGGIVGTGINFSILDDNGLRILNYSKTAVLPNSILESSDEQHAFPKWTAGVELPSRWKETCIKYGISLPRDLPTTAIGMSTYIQKHPNEPAALIAQGIFTRSAQLIACRLYSLAKYINQDIEPLIEGGLFWDTKGYFEEVNDTLELLRKNDTDSFKPKVTILPKLDQSSLLAAAKIVS